MAKTFSDEQVRIAQDLMSMQMDIENRTRNKITDTILRKPLTNAELKKEIDALKDSIEYILEEKIQLMKNYLN